ncbi:MAG: SURF1-like protein [Hyphococcus sp.]|nr:MAG: SURF1-like protein [Marinicaulis sp.]
MLEGRHFQFRPVLTVFTALGLAILIALGSWQMHRLSWKQELIAKVDARIEVPPIAFEDAVTRAEAGEDMEYTPVKLTGEWVPEKEAPVFGSLDGKAGVYLFAPLAPQSGSGVIYVNAGYVPQSTLRQENLGAPYLAMGSQEIIGLFRTREIASPPASWFRSVQKSVDGLWFMRDPLLFAADAGVETIPFYIDRFAVDGALWPKGGTTRIDFRNKHFEYALTWYGLAVALLGVWLVFSLPKKSPDGRFFA